MIVTKNGITLNLENQSHVDAYLSSGWVEAKASAPAAEVVAAEPMNAPEPAAEPVEIPQEEDVKVAPAPKARGRKKQEK